MAVDKLVDSTQLDSDLTSVANAIRTKGGTSAQLAFPSGFVTAIGNIPTGGGNDFVITITENQNQVWSADCTFADIQAAYNNDKNVVIAAYDSTQTAVAATGFYDSETPAYYCDVCTFDSSGNIKHHAFTYDSNGFSEDFSETTYNTSTATAVAADVLNGKIFFNANGKGTGTASGGGGGSGLSLIKTTAIGAVQTSSTSATDTGKTVSLAQSTGWQNYDLLLVDISVDTNTNGRHTSTVTPVFIAGTGNINTKNSYTVNSYRWNSKLSSTGTASTRTATTAYGVYINAASASDDTLTLTVYCKYNSSNTGTINGTYTARVYGVNLYDLIGG